jgi:hypothetical protein
MSYTEEQLKDISPEQFKALSPEEQLNIKGAAMALTFKKYQESLNSKVE